MNWMKKNQSARIYAEMESARRLFAWQPDVLVQKAMKAVRRIVETLRQNIAILIVLITALKHARYVRHALNAAHWYVLMRKSAREWVLTRTGLKP